MLCKKCGNLLEVSFKYKGWASDLNFCQFLQ